jgi:hypothetical protein
MKSAASQINFTFFMNEIGLSRRHTFCNEEKAVRKKQPELSLVLKNSEPPTNVTDLKE